MNPGSLHGVATRVLADANVLRSRTLRDWLLMLRIEADGMFTVQTTEDILAEVLYTLRRENPHMDGGKITRLHDHLKRTIDERIDEFTVDDSFPGTDPHDAHVHAAAIAAQSDKLLTCDSGWRDLDDEVLDELPYEVYHPDSFFVLVDDSAPRVVRAVAVQQARYQYKRDGEVDLPAWLRRAGCPTFAEHVRTHMMTIDCSEITA